MITFQLLGSTTRDVDGAYEITLFGSTAQGKSVSLIVTGFEPFFYLAPPTLTGYMTQVDGIKAVKESHKTFWDFTNNASIEVLKVTAPSKKLWLKARDLVLDKDTMTPRTLETPKRTITPTVYEANIDPILRFYHLREIKPAGWVQVGSDDIEEVDDPTTTTELQYTCLWSEVGPASPEIQLTSAPLRIMSWDIECTSSHGDFPQAIKTWRKPAREAIEAGLTPDEIIDEIRKAVQGQSKILAKIYLDAYGLKELEAGLASLGEFNVSDIDRLDEWLTKRLPTILGDPIIQIGAVTYVNGKASRKDIFVLGSCEPVEGVTVIPCQTEKALIESWAAMIKEVDPDLLIGYNIFGFDNKYLWERAKVVKAQPSLKTLGRETDKETWDPRSKTKKTRSPVTLKEKFLSSSAMGDNIFHMFTAEGRMHIDLLAYVRRNAVLDSYSLDNVTATYMAGGVSSVVRDGDHLKVLTKSTKGTGVGRAVVLMDDENDVLGDKFEVVGVEAKALLLKGSADAVTDVLEGRPVRWSQAKDNVSPQDIFRLHGLGPADRAIVAKYCIQDCDLVMELFQKLEVLNNSIAMANVCWVPLDYIFTRGQGIKSESLVFYECRKEGQLIPVQSQQSRASPESETDNNSEEDSEKTDQEGYEGAIVLDPLSGIYLDDEPVAALDFSSLYPSSIISENLSQDTVVWVKDYDQKGNLIGTVEGSDMYDNLEGIEYLEVDYDILKPDPKDKKKVPTLIRSGRRVCRYATSQQGTLPKILQKLLSARKATRKQAEKETDDFKKSLLDAQQLAYKLTANSLYGQLGSNTSKIRRKCLAASTTGHGRQQLLFSKACIEEVYGAGKDKRCDAVVVYGDTDSVFISFRPKGPDGERLRGREAQAAAKELAEEAGALISGALKPPHDFEFDKMFRCFCLLSKKRYVGDMTEGGLDDADYHRKSMGIVMKRRDNAPIVKTVYGGVIERILVERDVVSAFTFARQTARDLMAGKFPMKRLTITKSLKAEYKLVPAHKILADRIGERDPGNKPASNDRIPYVYVKSPTGRPYPKDTSQGDRIEIPSYIVEQGLTPDYAFYITNQIAKPVAQVFGLVLEKLPGIKPHQIQAAKKAKDPTAAREALAESLLFGDILVAASGQKDIRSWFTKAVTTVDA
jgi:DNA polymerase elongation subunit (family B)